jgi:hypothetical protein
MNLLDGVATERQRLLKVCFGVASLLLAVFWTGCSSGGSTVQSVFENILVLDHPGPPLFC